jgi:hypothetical protein
MDDRTAVHVSKTGKDLERNTQEVNQTHKALIQEINSHYCRVRYSCGIYQRRTGRDKGRIGQEFRKHFKRS